ncbi:fimbrial biogenesis chaperone [Pseudomarimonas arenosa]|uniref:Molecular chaperone n=1 Tax=Pseudomarimonas arenosa TaxID=2774145 RepID=A0AAW3ZEU3_9GAMM|nr:molecular chaperone [Pseudomarimonas arenosa]MBD8524658.1 molecular chaperone [Pseudomarimonas arenosa]
MQRASWRGQGWRGTRVGGLLCGLLFAGLSSAASLQINPTRVEIDQDSRVVALTLRNSGSDDANVQLELVQWTQVEGEDHYQPTTELLATPPIFSLAAGSQQIIRVGLRGTPDEQRERAFRLYVQELPPSAEQGFRGLRMMLRMSLPVFIAPVSGKSGPELEWRLRRLSVHEVELSVVNRGNGRAQVSELSLEHRGKRLVPGGMAYVLAGATRSWTLQSPADLADDAQLALTARIDGVQYGSQLSVH